MWTASEKFIAVVGGLLFQGYGGNELWFSGSALRGGDGAVIKVREELTVSVRSFLKRSNVCR